MQSTSIIGKFHHLFEGTDYLTEFAPIIEDAVLFMTNALSQYWDAAVKKNNGKRGSLPDEKQSVDVSQMPGRELGFEPINLHLFKCLNRPYGREGIDDEVRHFFSCDTLTGQRNYFDRTKDAVTKMLEAGVYPPHVRFIGREFLIPPMPTEYTTCLFPNLDSSSRNTFLPVVCNINLGEIYYQQVSVQMRGRTPCFTIWDTCPILVINWITGQQHYLFHELEGANSPLFETSAYIRKGFLAQSSSLMSDFPLTQGPLHIVDVNDVEAMNKASLESPDRRYEQALRSKPSITSSWTLPFLETLYALPPGALTDASFFGNRDTDMRPTMNSYLTLLLFTGPMFQSILQTTSYNRWFLNTLLCSIHRGTPLPAQYTNLVKWLGFNNIPDFRYFMRLPDEQGLMFFFLLNKYQKTTIAEYERIWQQTIVASAMWLDEYTTARKKPDIPVALKGTRHIFNTIKLPQFLVKYNTDFHLVGKIPVSRYLKYIVEEGKLSFDPITKTSLTLQDIESLLADYNRITREIVPKAPFTLPHNLRKAHDNIVKNYNRILAEKKVDDDVVADEFLAFAQCYRNKTTNPIDDDTFCCVKPLSSMNLYEEGIMLNHCVGSYGEDIMLHRGARLIYFLREKTRETHPLVTVQVDNVSVGMPYTLTEIAGKGNRHPTVQEREYAEKWLAAFNVAYLATFKMKASSKLTPTAFAPSVLDWLKLCGCFESMFPDFDHELDKDANYISLLQACIPFIVANANAESRLNKAFVESCKQSLAHVVSSLRLSGTTYRHLCTLINIEVCKFPALSKVA